MKETCENCRYSVPLSEGEERWRPAANQSHTLVCRRKSPVVLVFKDSPYQYHPMTSEQDWCGEWKAIVVTEPSVTCTMHFDPGPECLDEILEDVAGEKCVSCGKQLLFSARVIGDRYCHPCRHKALAKQKAKLESELAVTRRCQSCCGRNDGCEINDLGLLFNSEEGDCNSEAHAEAPGGSGSYVDTDGEKCVCCGQVGPDRCWLAMSCGIPMTDADDPPTKYRVPFQRLDRSGTNSPYTLRVCKSCRDNWLKAIGSWFTFVTAPDRSSVDQQFTQLRQTLERANVDLDTLRRRCADEQDADAKSVGEHEEVPH